MKTILIFSMLLILTGITDAHAAEPLFIDKGYIKEDTTWSGTVILRGQNVVKRGVTLTILPDTVVKFLWIDEDGDNIGDGELTVEGNLIAKGTKGHEILFTSAQPVPKKKDWTFVQVSVSKGSAVEYCRFEYAFSGLQVHYSAATVQNCIFNDNFEGMRFSTTDVNIINNEFINNTYGIRYEANGSRSTVRFNNFKDNEYAFFPVQKCAKTVLITENNITGSATYAVKLGDNQKQDMDYTGNWWGTADAAEIDALMYDKTKDATLGKVEWTPFLVAPVEHCGKM